MDLTEYNSHMHVCFNLPVQRKCAIFGQNVEKVHIPSQLLEKIPLLSIPLLVILLQFSSFQLLSRVRLFATP